MVMEDFKILFYSSKLPYTLTRISSQFTDNLGTRPRRV